MAGLWPGYGARGGEGQNGRVHVYAALPAGQGWAAGRMSRDNRFNPKAEGPRGRGPRFFPPPSPLL